ncbi:MAG: oxygen-independent coproporphyrinogen III oxidase [Parasphingorhabdus sp.]|nr:oxygen-independent coproporphyrinogen III oxidase [Parasphingorhabdus sp.]
MWPYYPEILAQPVPRYTSYPPATAFTADVGAAEQAEALNAVAPGTPISLYVHIPYCQSICWYCGCNTGMAGKAQRLHAYLDALEAEIALVARLLGGRGKLGRIAFGGGSPNAIEPLAFVRLVDLLVTTFAAGDTQIAVEIDPRAFTLDWAMTLAIAGVRRVSFGVQTFDPEIQAAIGRIQPVEMIETCVAALRARGIVSVNFDLMYGLPMQTSEKLEQTLDHVERMKPDRIALFGYAHLPEMFPRQRRIDASTLPDAKVRFDMAARGHERLVAAGYQAIGFDHFALPHDSLATAALKGAVHRNFQGFTDDDSRVVIGIGASAISVFPDRIVQNEKKSGPYRESCAAGQLAGSRGIKRETEAQRRAAIIEDILCTGEAYLDQHIISPAAKTTLEQFAANGLLQIDGKTLRLTESARPYARYIASTFDAGLSA